MGGAVKLPSELAGKAAAFLQKYRYPVLILVIGLVLLALPSKKKASTAPAEQTSAQTETLPAVQTDYCARTERSLAQILSQIDGAGQVRVMLTLASGPQTVYQTDSEEQTQTDGTQSSAVRRQETVILSRGSSYNEPAVVGTQYPVFRGALIVSEGADSPAVRYQLASAVSALLGIGTDRITVVKMK